MNKKGSHLIGTVVWDTKFYNETTASALQSDLSTWTNSVFLELLKEVFNSLSLENETIQISKLKINIGLY